MFAFVEFRLSFKTMLERTIKCTVVCLNCVAYNGIEYRMNITKHADNAKLKGNVNT